MGDNIYSAQTLKVYFGGTHNRDRFSSIPCCLTSGSLLQCVYLIFRVLLGCHDNGYVSTLNSFITSGYTEKLVLLPGYTDMAAGIAKLELRLIAIPDLFLAEKITLLPNQKAKDQSGSPSPSIPPTLPHSSSDGALMDRPSSGSPSRRINSNIVELIKYSSSPWKWN